MVRRARQLSKNEKYIWDKIVQSVRPLSKTDTPAKDKQPTTRHEDLNNGSRHSGQRLTPNISEHDYPKQIKSPDLEGRYLYDPSVKILSSPLIKTQPKPKKRIAGAKINSVLDLHGLTEAEAYESLLQFVTLAQGRGEKTLLVITGKGKGGQGVLKRNFPRWMESEPLSPRIREIRQAAPQHGGAGAFYLYLKH